MSIPKPICFAVMGPFLHFLKMFFSSCLHSLSIQVWHLCSAQAHSLSVCTLSARWGWLGEQSLHIFISWTIFTSASCCFRAADERDALCVGSTCSLSVCFSFEENYDRRQTWIIPKSAFCHNFLLFLCLISLVSLYFFCISPLLSLISYFYGSLVSPSLRRLTPFNFLFSSLLFIFLLFSSLLFYTSTTVFL